MVVVEPIKATDIERIHQTVCTKLKRLPGVTWSPSLRARDRQSYAITGLSLVFFAANLRRIVTKQQLVVYLRRHGCCDISAPNPRHFGMQNGLFFLVKDSYHPLAKRTLRPGEYCLYSLGKPHPARPAAHRSVQLPSDTFEALKSAYGHRCAVCGSKEKEPHLKNPTLHTRLEKGHMDPTQPLVKQNCIPICTLCNQVYKNRFSFSARGFVVRELLPAKPSAPLRVRRRRQPCPATSQPALLRPKPIISKKKSTNVSSTLPRLRMLPHRRVRG
jgi:hypothetical protein